MLLFVAQHRQQTTKPHIHTHTSHLLTHTVHQTCLSSAAAFFKIIQSFPQNVFVVIMVENKDDGGTPNEIKKYIKGKVVDGWWCWKNTFLYFFSLRFWRTANIKKSCVVNFFSILFFSSSPLLVLSLAILLMMMLVKVFFV